MRGRTSRRKQSKAPSLRCNPLGLEHLEPREFLSSSIDFTGPLVLRATDEVRAVISADLNADGIDDLVMSVGNQVRVRLGRADGTLGPATVAGQFTLNAGLLAAGDIDGDGHVDIAAARVAGTPGSPGPAQTWVRILRGDGTGGFTPGPMTLVGERVRSFSAAQFDVDRRMELLLNGLILDVRGVGAAERFVVTRAISGTVYDSTAADLDGDGRAEIVAIVPLPVGDAGSEAIEIERNRGGMTFTPSGAQSFDGALTIPESVALGDVTGDGRTDVVFTTMDQDGAFKGRTGYMTIQAGPAGALLPSAPTYVYTIDDPLDGKSYEIRGEIWIMGITDLDADGRNDILVGSMNSSYEERDGYVQQGAGATSLIAQTDGTFKPFNVGGADRFATGATTPDKPPLFSLYSSAGTGGDTHGPDVLVLDQDGYGRWLLTRRPNTEAWKPPVVDYLSQLILTPVAGSPNRSDNPQHDVYVGDRIGLYAYGFTAEAPRGASVTGLRFTLDSSGDGSLDAGDVVLGDGVNDESNRWHLFTVVDSNWANAAVDGVVTVFFTAIDSTGVVGPPMTLRFNVFTL